MYISRRRFLCGAAALSINIPVFLRAVMREADAATNTILIVIQQQGGNDGFNMIIPTDSVSESAYQTHRSQIALSPEQPLPEHS